MTSLSFRALRACAVLGVETVEDLKKHTIRDLIQIPGIGRKTVRELREALEDRGLSLRTGPTHRFLDQITKPRSYRRIKP